MQKLFYLLLGENSVILFYNNNFMIYLVTLSDFDNLKLDKILEIFIKSLWVFCKISSHIKLLSYITKLNLGKLSDV